MELIDKSDIIAEIEKIYNEDYKFLPSDIVESVADFKDDLLMVLGSLSKVKEIEVEQEIKNEIDNLPNLYCYMEDLFNGNEEEGIYPIPEKVKNELFEFAKHFFELGLKAQKGKSFIDTLETKEEDKEETKWFPSKKQMECLKDIYD